MLFRAECSGAAGLALAHLSRLIGYCTDCHSLRRDSRRCIAFSGVEGSLACPLLASHTFNGFFVPAALRSCAMDAVPMVFRVGSAWLTPCSPLAFPILLKTAASRSGAMSADGTLSVWYSLAHTLLASHAFDGSMRRLPHAQAR